MTIAVTHVGAKRDTEVGAAPGLSHPVERVSGLEKFTEDFAGQHDFAPRANIKRALLSGNYPTPMPTASATEP